MKHIFSDFRSGIIVFLVSIPLCLGIAIASHAPIQSGIISGIVGGMIVGMLSNSQVNVSGPSPAMIAIVYTAITNLNNYPVFLSALVLAGFIQIIIAALKIAKFGRYVPSGVIQGLLCAVGVILIFNQTPTLFGYSLVPTGDFAFFKNAASNNTIMTLYDAIKHIDIGCTIIGLGSIAIFVICDKIGKRFGFKNIPAPLFIVGFSIVMVTLFYKMKYLLPTLPISVNQLVQLPIIGHHPIERFFALMIKPNFNKIMDIDVIYTAIIIAFAGSIESILSTEAGDKLDPEKRHTSLSKEMFAQGAGNILCGLFGGLPIAAVVLRTSVNVSSGSKTKNSTIINGTLLLIAVTLIPKILNTIPISALAAILIMSGIRLIKSVDVKKIYKRGLDCFIPFIVTLITIFFSSILEGIFFGLFASAFFVLKSYHKNPFKSISEKYSLDEAIRIKLPKQVSFLNKIAFVDLIKSIPSNSTVTIDAEECTYVDYDILDIIIEFKDFYAVANNIKVTLNGFLEKYEIENSPFITTITKEQQEKMTPQQILDWIIAGNKRFIDGEHIYHSFAKQRESTATKQHPMAVILSCIDSRSAPELIFDLGIGDAVSIRIAGNIVNDDIIGSIEFSCKQLGAKLIVVLGHTKCGAVDAACGNYDGPVAKDILLKIRPIAQKVRGYFSANCLSEEVIKMNVINSNNLIAQSSILKGMIDSGEVKIVSAVYNIATGVVDFID